MNVKELMEQLRLAKNKDVDVLFRNGDDNLTLDLMAEVVNDDKGVHFPTLGETSNALVIKLASKTSTVTEDRVG